MYKAHVKADEPRLLWIVCVDPSIDHVDKAESSLRVAPMVLRHRVLDNVSTADASRERPEGLTVEDELAQHVSWYGAVLQCDCDFSMRVSNSSDAGAFLAPTLLGGWCQTGQQSPPSSTCAAMESHNAHAISRHILLWASSVSHPLRKPLDPPKAECGSRLFEELRLVQKKKKLMPTTFELVTGLCTTWFPQCVRTALNDCVPSVTR